MPTTSEHHDDHGDHVNHVNHDHDDHHDDARGQDGLGDVRLRSRANVA